MRANDATEYLDTVEEKTGREDGLVTSLDDILTAWRLLNKDVPDVMKDSGSNIDISEAWDQVKESLECRELIWAKEYLDPTPVPDHCTFLGCDAAYLQSDHFSCISDAMFFPIWHGCDIEGVALLGYYNRLNTNGLFDSNELALAYLKHYQSFDWAEKNGFTSIEVYSVAPPGGTVRDNEE